MTVVGADRDDGVVAEFGVVTNAVEELGELFVHGVENAVIESSLAAAPLIEWWPEGAVNIVGPKVDEEGFVFGLGFVDELESLIDEAGGEFKSLHPLVAFTESFGVGPNASFDWVAAIGVWFQGKRQELGSDAFEVGE